MTWTNFAFVFGVFLTGLLIGGFGAFLLFEVQDLNEVKKARLTDEEYIQIASQTLVVERFLMKYPDANAIVDRSGSLAVDFWVEETRDPQESLRLRVFISPKTNFPMESFIHCYAKNEYFEERENILAYIDYENCLS